MLIKKRNPKLRKVGIRLIAVGIILIVLLILTDLRVRPMIHKAGEFHCRVLAVRIINQAVTDELASLTYGELVNLTHDESGHIISIESNMAGINRLKARVTGLINDNISTIEQSDLQIPVGTVSGINMLYGRGPAIPVRLTPRGSANVNLASVFTSAGINQTLHQITLTVSVDISAIIPGYTNSVTVETSFIVAQTIIVGTVPDSYTHIIIG
jgi:sporulation protein YunB